MFSLSVGRHGFLAWRQAVLWAPAHPYLPPHCAYILANDPQGPEELEDTGATGELGSQHCHIPQALVLGAAAWWQGPGAVWVAQQLQQRFRALLTQRPLLLLPWGACICDKAGLVLQGVEKQLAPRRPHLDPPSHSRAPRPLPSCPGRRGSPAGPGVAGVSEKQRRGCEGRVLPCRNSPALGNASLSLGNDTHVAVLETADWALWGCKLDRNPRLCGSPPGSGGCSPARKEREACVGCSITLSPDRGPETWHLPFHFSTSWVSLEFQGGSSHVLCEVQAVKTPYFFVWRAQMTPQHEAIGKLSSQLKVLLGKSSCCQGQKPQLCLRSDSGLHTQEVSLFFPVIGVEVTAIDSILGSVQTCVSKMSPNEQQMLCSAWQLRGGKLNFHSCWVLQDGYQSAPLSAQQLITAAQIGKDKRSLHMPRNSDMAWSRIIRWTSAQEKMKSNFL